MVLVHVEAKRSFLFIIFRDNVGGKLYDRTSYAEEVSSSSSSSSSELTINPVQTRKEANVIIQQLIRHTELDRTVDSATRNSNQFPASLFLHS